MFGRRRPRRIVLVYSREGCHLCDEAIALLEGERRRHRLEIEVKDIGGDAELEARHGHEIPVVFIDGRKRFMGRVDRMLLRRLLSSPPNEDSSPDAPA